MASKLNSTSTGFNQLQLDSKSIITKSKFSTFKLVNDTVFMNFLESNFPKVFFMKIRFVGKGFRLQS